MKLLYCKTCALSIIYEYFFQQYIKKFPHAFLRRTEVCESGGFFAGKRTDKIVKERLILRKKGSTERQTLIFIKVS